MSPPQCFWCCICSVSTIISSIIISSTINVTHVGESHRNNNYTVQHILYIKITSSQQQKDTHQSFLIHENQYSIIPSHNNTSVMLSMETLSYGLLIDVSEHEKSKTERISHILFILGLAYFEALSLPNNQKHQQQLYDRIDKLAFLDLPKFPLQPPKEFEPKEGHCSL